MRNYFNSFFDFFEFDGKPSTDFGVMVFSHGEYADPEPNESEVRIPGMNGVLHFWDGTFSDIKITYSVMVKGETAIEVREKVERMRAWLLSRRKYCRLQDTFHPDYYRMGIYNGKSDVEYSANEQMGKLVIEFQCKPQKFLVSGEMPIHYSQNGLIFNPTDFTANPLITLYGSAGASGAFNIKGGQSVNFIFPASGTIIIDADISEAYDVDGTSLNANISFPSTNTKKDMPRIDPGENSVLLFNVTKAVIVPRWWTL